MSNDKNFSKSLNKKKEEIESKLREYVCIRCGAKMKEYSFGLGCACRCAFCGYKDGCCE